MVRAIKSQPRQKMAPPKKHAGITVSGLAVFRKLLIRCGTAMPTNDTGPANAVTVAASKLDSKMSVTRKTFTFTPMLWL